MIKIDLIDKTKKVLNKIEFVVCDFCLDEKTKPCIESNRGTYGTIYGTTWKYTMDDYKLSCLSGKRIAVGTVKSELVIVNSEYKELYDSRQTICLDCIKQLANLI